MVRDTPAVDDAYRNLLEHLESGRYSATSRLPGERLLAAEFGVSRATLRQGLTRLADEGLIYASSNRGWYVRGLTTGSAPSSIQSFTEMAAARGLAARSQVIRNSVRSAEYDEARLLRIAPGARVVELVRVRFMEEVAICHDRTVLPLELVPSLPETDMQNASLYEFLRTEAGLEVVRSTYTIRAELMGADLAALLDVDAASPTLIADELSFKLDDTPVLQATLSYRGDAYRFQTHHLRFRSGGS